MAMMSTADKNRWWWQRRTINWKDGGRRQETTARRDSDERWQRQRIGGDDCDGLRRLPQTAMAADDDGVERRRHARVADNDGQRMRPGDKQRRHSAFIRGNNC